MASEGEYTVIGRASGPGPTVGISGQARPSVDSSTALGGDLGGTLPDPEVTTVLGGLTPATVDDLNSLRDELRSPTSTPDHEDR